MMSNLIYNALIVEDSPVMSRLLIQFLLNIGQYECQVATHVSTAKSLLLTDTFDFIICDIMLPGKEDGIDFLRYVRKDQRFYKLPFYIITSNLDENLKTLATSLECTGFLFKPFTRIQLKEMLTNEKT